MFSCLKKKKVYIEAIQKPSYPRWYNRALTMVGTGEIAGSVHNETIQAMYDAVVGKRYGDEVPWCAAFVGFCLSEVGYRTTGSLLARSYMNYGKEVAEPEVGDIVVYWRDREDGWKGHVGFFVKFDGDYIVTLGGNQDDAVNFKRYPIDMVLSYRRVTNEEKKA